MYILDSYPSFRVLMPLTVGILLYKLLANGADICLPPAAVIAALTGTVIILIICYHSGWHILFGVITNIVFATCGFSGALQADKKAEHYYSAFSHNSKSEYTVCITDYPIAKEKSTMVRGNLTGGECGVLLYFYAGDTAALELEPSDTITVTANIQPPQQFVPDFDYKAYLARQGVYGTAFIAKEKWSLNSHSVTGFPLKRIRHKLTAEYDTWGIDSKEVAVLKALTLADKTALDQSLKDTYSHSGASHVLAVSGLHVGILYFLLSLLIPVVRRPKWLGWIRELVIILLLWSYACMIGLPFSITRSLIMFSFLSLTRILGRDNNSINTLCFAAVVILAANPLALFDSGLQLSFAAVFSILYFQPKIALLWTPKNIAVKYFYDIITVSIAAQIGTAPLIIYYFGGISVLFLLTNIIVIPLVYLALMAVMATWIFRSIPWILFSSTVAHATAHIAGWFLHIVNGALEWISGIGWSYVEMDINNFSIVFLFYCILFATCIWLWNKKTKALIFSMSALAILLLITLPFWHIF